jgi:hypothetical protein
MDGARILAAKRLMNVLGFEVSCDLRLEERG